MAFNSLCRLLRLYLFSFVMSVRAIRFTSNCTMPPEGVHFVSGPPLRGTMNIAWSCIFVFFLCTWTVQHQNVPRYRDSSDDTTWQKYKQKFTRAGTKFKWMLFSFLLPEVLMGRAFGENIAAGRSQVDMYEALDQLYPDQNETYRKRWTLTHAFYANMGGFVLKIPGDLIPASCREWFNQADSPRDQQPDTDTERIDPPDLGIIFLTLNARQVQAVLKQGIIDLPEITEAEIQDKNKGDFFIKGTAILQSVWMAVQVVWRWAKPLPVTQLEVSAFAFSVCTLITYLFWWNKPQGVNEPTILEAKPNACINEQCAQQLDLLSEMSWIPSVLTNETRFRDDLRCPIPNDASFKVAFKGLDFFGRRSRRLRESAVAPSPTSVASPPLPQDGANEPLGFTYVDVGVVIGAFVFGGLHFTALATGFPTWWKMFLWLFASAIMCSCFLIFAVAAYLWKGAATKMGIVGRILLILYILPRSYVIVESVRTLFYPSPRTFVTIWAKYVPHVN